MATFVLVHGGFTGGWFWRPVARRLRGRGHEVYTPTLTGFGERVHLASPDVGLATHVEDVVNVLRYEDLHDVVLVGKSYAGMVITGVAERVPDRLTHLVFLEAAVPRDGEALVNLLDPVVVAQLEAAAQAAGDGWRVPVPQPPLDPRLTPLPLRPALEPVVVKHPAAAALPRTFIAATQRGEAGVMAAIARSARRARAAGWRYAEVPTGHEPEQDAPDDVARLLLEVA